MRTFVDPYHPGEPPLPSWRSPRPGEPAHGFVVRHAGLNRRASTRTMLIDHGLNGRNLQPDECLAFALSLPFTGRDDLVHATPILSDTGVTLMGQTVRRRQWRIEHRRFCPACLAEDAYHRAWWDLVDFRRCPHHDTDVVGRDRNGRVVPWWFPSFVHASSGLPLATFGIPRRTEPRPSPETYILARLGMVEPVAVPLLDGLATLGDALDAVRLLGRIAMWGTAPSRPAYDDDGSTQAADVMEAGFAVARRGEPAVLALLHHVADARTRADGGRAKKSCFGWIREELWREERGSLALLFEGLVDRVMVERNRRPSGSSGDGSDGSAGWLPLPALARELGMPVSRLRQVSQALGIHGRTEKHARNRYLMLLAQEADLVRDTLAGLIDRVAAASLLGVTHGCIDGLVRSGRLRPFAGLGRRKAGNCFRTEDVEALADRLLANSTPVAEAPNGLVRIGILEATARLDPSKPLADILDDAGRLHFRMGPKVGDLLVPERQRRHGPGAMAKAREAIGTRPGISRHEAASLIGCRPRTVDGLLTAGLITPVPASRRVDVESVHAFRHSWAPAETYREALGHKVGDRRTGRCLERLGVTCRRLTLADGYDAYLVERASARSVLGLRHDPDALETGTPRAFEAGLLERFFEHGTFRRNGQGRSLTLISRASDLALCVAVRPAEAVVVLELLRYSTTSGHDLDEQVRFARRISGRRLDVRVADGGLAATLRIPAPELPHSTAWPDLIERVVFASEIFRAALPQRRRARKAPAVRHEAATSRRRGAVILATVASEPFRHPP